MENEARVYRVDDLTIDPVSGAVTRGDEAIVLPKLSYDLLMTLTRCWPKLLSVDELMARAGDQSGDGEPENQGSAGRPRGRP
jgi:DNA-binding response OmpR family regulator